MNLFQSTVTHQHASFDVVQLGHGLDFQVTGVGLYIEKNQLLRMKSSTTVKQMKDYLYKRYE